MGGERTTHFAAPQCTSAIPISMADILAASRLHQSRHHIVHRDRPNRTRVRIDYRQHAQIIFINSSNTSFRWHPHSRESAARSSVPAFAVPGQPAAFAPPAPCHKNARAYRSARPYRLLQIEITACASIAALLRGSIAYVREIGIHHSASCRRVKRQ